MKRISRKYALLSSLITILFLMPGISLAGGYLLVSNTGVPYQWDNSIPIPQDFDGGDFGVLIGAAAFTFAEAAVDIWAAEPTLNLSFTTTGGALTADGDVDTVPELLALIAPGDGISPIIFDVDGSLFAALGFPPGVIGFAFIKNSSADAPFIITESFQAYNGAFIDGINDPGAGNFEFGDISEMGSTITHEMGHALNFDHTQVNGQYFIGDTGDPGFTLYGPPPAGVGVVNIMFPFSLGSGGNDTLVPNRDDLSTAELLYGNGAGPTGAITGTIFRSDGATLFQGANVIARNNADPFFDASSNVSGALFSPFSPFPADGSPDPALEGAYVVSGLTSGAQYTVEVTNVNPRFVGGSSVGPFNQPVVLGGPEEFYNGLDEANADPPDDPNAFELVSVTSTIADINVIVNFLPDFPVADLGVCYATTGSADGRNFITIDPATGARTVIGPTKSNSILGLAINSNGDVFGSGSGGGLYRIDALTGEATLVASTGLGLLRALAFDASDVLFALDPTGGLHTIDTQTGTPTLLGNAGDDFWGMAFDPTNDILWASTASTSIVPDAVFTIDQRNGAATFVGQTGLGEEFGDNTPDIHFDADGSLFGVKGANAIDNVLIAIDKSNGAGTVIGPLGGRSVFGMAFRPEAPAGSNISVVPFNAIDFGGILLPNSSAASVTITSIGTEDLTITEISDPGEPFILSGLPSLPIVLAPLESIDFGVTFSPTSGGSAAATISITSDDVNTPDTGLALTGEGIQLDAAQAGVCYASTGFASGGLFLTINPGSGAGTVLGPTGLLAAPGLAINSAGDIFATDVAASTNLYRIDPANGRAIFVANTGLPFVEAIAFDENDVLYGISGFGLLALFSIDPATGAPSFLGPLNMAIQGMAFDPTDGTLFGSAGGGNFGPSDTIVTIDKSSAALTVVGLTGLGGSTPDIHFDLAGNLFGSKGGGSSLNSLISIDKATGAGTVIGSIGLPAVSGMATFKQAQASAQISVVPLNTDFRGVPLETTSAARSVTVSNIGDSDLTVSDILLADASGSYTLGDLPALPVVIPSAGSETFSVTFTPAGAGAANATITINSDDADDPAVIVNLTGEGREAFKTTFADNGGADFDEVTSDAFLDKGKPDFNHGVSKFIRVGNDGPANRRPNRTVIKFDFLSGLAVSGVTESSQVLNAYVELRVFSSEGTDDDGLAIDIFQLNRDWTEGDKGHTPADAGEVTWLAAMADVEDWSVAGAAGVGADRAGTPDDTQLVGSSSRKIRWDVTSSVQAILASGENYGWLLQAQNEATNQYFRFYSSEHPRRASRRPRLVVTANVLAGSLAKASGATPAGEQPVGLNLPGSDEPGERSSEAALPSEFGLAQNYPNPFNPETKIRYQLPTSAAVTLTIYDLIGREVKTLVNQETKPAGTYTLLWDGRNSSGGRSASGIYVYRIVIRSQGGESGPFVQTRRMVLLK